MQSSPLSTSLSMDNRSYTNPLLTPAQNPQIATAIEKYSVVRKRTRSPSPVRKVAEENTEAENKMAPVDDVLERQHHLPVMLAAAPAMTDATVVSLAKAFEDYPRLLPDPRNVKATPRTGDIYQIPDQTPMATIWIRQYKEIVEQIVPLQASLQPLFLLDRLVRFLPRMQFVHPAQGIETSSLFFTTRAWKLPTLRPAELALLLSYATRREESCQYGDKCVSMTVPLPLRDGEGKRTADEPLPRFMTPHELQHWTMQGVGPIEPRPCLLCIMRQCTHAHANLVSAAARSSVFQADPNWVWQPFRIDEKEYDPECVLLPPVRGYIGMVDAMLRFSVSRLKWAFHETHGWYLDPSLLFRRAEPQDDVVPMDES